MALAGKLQVQHLIFNLCLASMTSSLNCFLLYPKRKITGLVPYTEPHIETQTLPDSRSSQNQTICHITFWWKFPEVAITYLDPETDSWETPHKG